MKLFQKLILGFVVLSSFIFESLATEIHFTSNQTKGTTDDIFKVHISVDGQVDKGELEIIGLENFEVVGQQSSSQIQIINGKRTAIQEKIISLQANNSGKFQLIAFAKENGKEVQSDPISFEIKKSVIQTTKENLLKNTSNNIQNKEVLGSNTKNIKPFQSLETSEIKSFPKVEHLSAFNGIFWIQFLGILFFMPLFISIALKAKDKFKQGRRSH